MSIPLPALLLLGIWLGAVAAPTPLPNGSFEDGLTSFWTNRPEEVRVDASRASHGRQCLALPTRPVESAATLYTTLPDWTAETVYQLTFATATDAPGQATVAAQVMVSADQPIGFWHPSQPAALAPNGAVAAAWTPTDAWSACTLTVGPVPATMDGKPVRRIGVFLRATGAAGHTVWVDDLQLAVVGRAVAAAAAPTVAPAGLAIVLPAPVQVFTQTVTVQVQAAQPPAGARLQVTVHDERGDPLRTVEGPAEQALALTLDEPGYHAIAARLTDAAGAVLHAATASLALLTPLPADYDTTSEPAFGVWGLDPALLRLGGAKWTRQPTWRLFEERGGPLTGTPPPAADLAGRPPIKVVRELNLLSPFEPMRPLPREQWADASSYLERAAAGRRGLVEVWETQNEPMVGEIFHGTMEDVADLMRLTSAAVRRGDPGRPVAGICINPLTPGHYAQYLRYFRDLGASDYLDAVTIHPYTPMSQSPDVANLVGGLNRLADDLRKIAGREVPLYITEIGYSSQPAGEVTEQQQAWYLARTALLARQVPALRATIWHIGYYADGKLTREGCYSLMRYAEGRPKAVREPKPAYAALATMSRQTYDARFVRPLELGANRVGLLFERRGQPLVVAYTRDDAPSPLRLLVGAPEVSVTSVCGRQRTLPAVAGVLSLPLDGAPVYIAGAAPEVFTGDALQATFSPPELSVLPGGAAALTVRLPGLAALTGATAVAELPPGWSATCRLLGDQLAVALVAPAGAAPEPVSLFLKVQTGHAIHYAWQRQVQVVPPLALAEVTPWSDADDGLGLTARVVPARPVSGAVLRVLQGARTVALLRLPAKGRCQVALHDLVVGQALPLTAEIVLPDGYRWRAALPPLATFTLDRREIVADGRLDDWAGASWYPIGDATGDLAHGQLAFAWDRHGLALAARIADSSPHPGPASGSLFNGDGLQLGVAIAPEDLLAPIDMGIQETAFADVGLTAGAPPASWVWATMNRQTMPLDGPIPGLRAAVVPGPAGVIYEAHLPWATLGARKPRIGQLLRLSVVLNDRTPGGRRFAEWYGGIAQGKDPGSYGIGVLTAP